MHIIRGVMQPYTGRSGHQYIQFTNDITSERGLYLIETFERLFKIPVPTKPMYVVATYMNFHFPKNIIQIKEL
jgi:hypothetical protein